MTLEIVVADVVVIAVEEVGVIIMDVVAGAVITVMESVRLRTLQMGTGIAPRAII